MSNAKPLIVMALKSEGLGKLEHLGYEVLYCGVGKINATYNLTCALKGHAENRNRYPYVLNLGFAGSPRFTTGDLVAANCFVQRDIDVTSLGFLHGESSFDDTPRLIEFERRFSNLPHGLCSSGDAFLQGPCPVEGEIIDMEAYALAKVCLLEGISFASVKYITDGADHTAHHDWNTNVRKAAEAFYQLLLS